MITIQEKIGLAQVFGEKLQLAVTSGQMRELIYRNKCQPDMLNDPVCHSHDFCDANMVMLEAWQEFFGGDPDMSSGDEIDTPDMIIWNEAWLIAKAADFFI